MEVNASPNGKSSLESPSKHRSEEEPPVPKRQKLSDNPLSSPTKGDTGAQGPASPPPVEEQNIFEKFTFKQILKADPSHKIAFIHGTFADGKDAVVILERMAWESEKFEDLFGSTANGSLAFKNDIFHNYRVKFDPKFNETKVTLIYPATEMHIKKYSSQPTHLIDESPEDYKEITVPSLKTSKRFSAQWVDNILDHEKETDRIVYEDTDPEKGFILLPDLKWDGHNVDSLYLVAIVHKRGIHSIRELSGENLPMLENMKIQGTEAISKKYGLPASRIRAFLHYQPTFYHLHVHFTNVQFDAPGRNAEKAHMLTTVISNLKANTDYYKNATIPFMVGENDPLFPAYADRLKPVKQVQRSDNCVNGAKKV